MATLASLRSRLLSMEGHERSDDALVALNATESLNAAYRELCQDQPWFFTMQTETVTGAGGYLTLATNTIHVVDVFDVDGNRCPHKTRSVQIRYAEELESLDRTTWAIEGYAAGTSSMRLRLSPVSTGVFTILSAYLPADMAADADVPVGPSIVGEYILWSARQSRIKEDEERQYLDNTAREMMQRYRGELNKMHTRLTREDGPFMAR